MNSIGRGLAFVALCALPIQSMAAERKCASREELRTGIAYIMPALMKGVVTKCATALPADSYLAKDGEALIARYAGQSIGAEGDVRALFEKFGPQAGLAGADGKSTADLVESIVTVGIQSAIKPEICPDISTAMALLDPLPAANMNGLIEFILIKVDEGNARKSALQDGTKSKKGKDAEKRPSAPFLCESLALALDMTK